jgi:hypothetical protein
MDLSYNYSVFGHKWIGRWHKWLSMEEFFF